jgi:hypothetical protein
MRRYPRLAFTYALAIAVCANRMSGISDTFVAGSLWTLDYALQLAAVGQFDSFVASSPIFNRHGQAIPPPTCTSASRISPTICSRRRSPQAGLGRG